MPGLVAMLRTDDVQVQSLGHLGLEAKAAVPDLLTLALSNTNLSTNAAAARRYLLSISARRLVDSLEASHARSHIFLLYTPATSEMGGITTVLRNSRRRSRS